MSNDRPIDPRSQAASERPSDAPLLKREAIVQAAPQDDTRRIVLIGFGALALASIIFPLVGMLARSHSDTTVILIEHASSSESAVLAVMDEIPAASDAVLARDTAAGIAFEPGASLNAHRAWRGVAASPGRYGVSAVWSDTELYVSRDDGQAFRQVLGGPGDIGGVTIDESGAVFAVRDHKRLGVHGAMDSEVWRELPFAGDTLAFTTGPGWLGWLGLTHDQGRDSSVVLAISQDSGQTWRTQSLAEHADQALLDIEESGQVHVLLMLEDVMGARMTRLRAHVDGHPPEPMSWPSQYTDAWGLGYGGWAYAIASECATQDDDICAMGPNPSDALLSTGTRTNWNLLMASNHQGTFAVSGKALLRFDHERVVVADERIPTNISAVSVDGIGRVHAVAGQHLLRWSEAHGWRVLYTRDGRID